MHVTVSGIFQPLCSPRFGRVGVPLAIMWPSGLRLGHVKPETPSVCWTSKAVLKPLGQPTRKFPNITSNKIAFLQWSADEQARPNADPRRHYDKKLETSFSTPRVGAEGACQAVRRFGLSNYEKTREVRMPYEGASSIGKRGRPFVSSS